MGYSCSMIAKMTLNHLTNELQKAYTYKHDPMMQNTWEIDGRMYFYEIGRENRDGSITGKVWKGTTVGPKPDLVRPAGGFKIDRSGKVLRFPTATKKMKETAESLAQKEMNTRPPMISYY